MRGDRWQAGKDPSLHYSWWGVVLNIYFFLIEIKLVLFRRSFIPQGTLSIDMYLLKKVSKLVSLVVWTTLLNNALVNIRFPSDELG